MDTYDSTGSEFDSDYDEKEISLYTSLYFGNNIEESKKQIKENEQYSINTPSVKDQITIISDRKKATLANENTSLNIKATYGTSINNEHVESTTIEGIVPVPVLQLNREQVLLHDQASGSLNSMCILNNDESHVQNTEYKNSYLNLGKTFTNSTLKPRKRNISICSSTGSISGRQALDNLYCYDDDEVEFIPNLLTISENAPISESIYQVTELDSPKNSAIVNNKNDKNSSLSKSSSESSSDEEECIYPANAKPTVEIYTIDSGPSASSDEIEILDTVPPKTKANGNTPIKTVAALKKFQADIKAKKKKESVYNYDSTSDTDSDTSFYELMRTTPKHLLNLNIRKEAKPSHFNKCLVPKRKKKIDGVVKSRMIYSRFRPFTNTTPSCAKWTQEMASFYDTDASEDFDLVDVHAAQSDYPHMWEIINEDRKGLSRSRYFNRQIRCTQCREFGHHVSKCSHLPHCLYCGSTKHKSINKCPENKCLRCGDPSQHSYCHLTSSSICCHECGQYGHVSSLCPDLWRRFHSTTSGDTPEIPPPASQVPKRVAYCYFCAKKGHFGHQCRERGFKSYVSLSTEIFNYSDPSTLKMSLNRSMENQGATPRSAAKNMNLHPVTGLRRNTSSSCDSEIEEIIASPKKKKKLKKIKTNTKLRHAKLFYSKSKKSCFGTKSKFLHEVGLETNTKVVFKKVSGTDQIMVKMSGQNRGDLTRAKSLVEGLVFKGAANQVSHVFNERMKNVELAHKVKANLKKIQIDASDSDSIDLDDDELVNALDFIQDTLERPRIRFDQETPVRKTKKLPQSERKYNKKKSSEKDRRKSLAVIEDGDYSQAIPLDIFSTPVAVKRNSLTPKGKKNFNGLSPKSDSKYWFKNTYQKFFDPGCVSDKKKGRKSKFDENRPTPKSSFQTPNSGKKNNFDSGSSPHLKQFYPSPNVNPFQQNNSFNESYGTPNSSLNVTPKNKSRYWKQKTPNSAKSKSPISGKKKIPKTVNNQTPNSVDKQISKSQKRKKRLARRNQTPSSDTKVTPNSQKTPKSVKRKTPENSNAGGSRKKKLKSPSIEGRIKKSPKLKKKKNCGDEVLSIHFKNNGDGQKRIVIVN